MCCQRGGSMDITVLRMLVSVTFWCPGDLGWYPCLRLCTRVCRTVARNQHVVRNCRSPEDPAGLGLKDVLMARLGIQREGRCLLASMPWTTPCIGKAQAMGARRDPYGVELRTRINGLGVECQEVYRWGPYHERIRLRLAWLCGRRETTQEPDGPTDQPQGPEESSAHDARSRGWVALDPVVIAHQAGMASMMRPRATTPPPVPAQPSTDTPEAQTPPRSRDPRRPPRGRRAALAADGGAGPLLPVVPCP